jgi:hypothetical protein
MGSINHFPGNPITRLRNLFRRQRPGTRPGQAEVSAAVAVVEQVIQGTDERIRLVNDHKRVLIDPVITTLKYTSSIIDQIPPAIEVSSNTYVSNPYVNAFFANIEELQSVFSRSSELRYFIDDYQHHDVKEICALLCMHMSEKTALGMELAGDTLKKDVRQIAVNFSDHHVYSPAPTEAETRQGLRNCMLEGLTTMALDRVVQLRLSRQSLVDEQRILQTRLRSRQADNWDSLDTGKTREKLGRIEEAMKHTPPASPEETLKAVKAVFSQPEKYIRLKKTSLRIDRMGIKRKARSTEQSNRLQLVEVTIGNEEPRIITLARFPRNEILPRIDIHEWTRERMRV